MWWTRVTEQALEPRGLQNSRSSSPPPRGHHLCPCGGRALPLVPRISFPLASSKTGLLQFPLLSWVLRFSLSALSLCSSHCPADHAFVFPWSPAATTPPLSSLHSRTSQNVVIASCWVVTGRGHPCRERTVMCKVVKSPCSSPEANAVLCVSCGSKKEIPNSRLLSVSTSSLPFHSSSVLFLGDCLQPHRVRYLLEADQSKFLSPTQPP